MQDIGLGQIYVQRGGGSDEWPWRRLGSEVWGYPVYRQRRRIGGVRFPVPPVLSIRATVRDFQSLHHLRQLADFAMSGRVPCRDRWLHPDRLSLSGKLATVPHGSLNEIHVLAILVGEINEAKTRSRGAGRGGEEHAIY